jgi:hypothetical protein
MSSPALAWWTADAIALAALRQLTRGTLGAGPTTVGTLTELYSATGDFSTCPAYLAPQELPALATGFDTNGFPLDGAYANRQPDTQVVDELLVPFVYLWTDSSALVERMDSQSAWYEQRLLVLCRVRRSEATSLTPGGYGVTVAREFALREALNLSRGVQYLLARDLARTCRSIEAATGFGVGYCLQAESSTETPNYGADGDTYCDVIASLTVLQLRNEPAISGA